MNVKVSPGGGHGNPLQYFCLENPLDRRAGYNPSGCEELDMTKQLSTHVDCGYFYSEGFCGSPSAFSLPERMGKVTASKPFSPTVCPPGLPLGKIIIHGMQWHNFFLDFMKLKLMMGIPEVLWNDPGWNGGEGRRGLQRDRRQRMKQRKSDSRRKRMVHLMKIRPPGDFPDGSVAKTLGSQCRSAWEWSMVKELDPVCCS